MRSPHSFSGTLASSVLMRERVTGISVTWGGFKKHKEEEGVKERVWRVCKGRMWRQWSRCVI